MVRVCIKHPSLERPIIILPRILGLLNPWDIFDKIESVLSSDVDIPMDEDLEINTAIVKLPSGNGRSTFKKGLAYKISSRSVLRITSNQNCLARAIVVAIARKKYINNATTANKSEYDRLRNCRNAPQEVRAIEVMKKLGLDLSKEGDISQIPLYEVFYQTSICCYSDEVNIRHPIYKGSPKFVDTVALLHSVENNVGHFDVCCNPKGMIGTSEHCESCGAFFNDRLKHSCFLWCNVCGRKNCQDEKQRTCEDCNRICRSYDCYKAHKFEKQSGRGKDKGQNLPSMCSQNWVCPDCGILLKTRERDSELHECGEMKCSVCNQYNFGDHKCYMRAARKELINPKFLFYDFECRQESGIHVPNFCVVQSMCEMCEDDEVTSDSKCNICGSRCFVCDKTNLKKEYERNPCNTCGNRQVIFKGESTKEKFCEWLFSKQHTDFSIIAHNAKGYDNYFLYNYLVNKNIKPDHLIFQGSKLMYMHIAAQLNIKALDSVNFLPMPLSRLPKSFDLKELKKGFFPHFFNTLVNQNVKMNTLPDQEFYGCKSFSKENHEEFQKWYSENYSNGFDFQKEIEEYCISDVNILLNACKKFRRLLLETTGSVDPTNECIRNQIFENAVDPFAYLTIASVCLGVFKSKFLQEKWKVLTVDEAKRNMSCHHEYNCTCKWLESRKENADAYLQVWHEGSWVSADTLNIARMKFISSPIGLIPPHGYAGSDNHSKEAMEWLHVVERDFRNKGDKIEIISARSQSGEKRILCQGKSQMISYKVDGYFELNGEKYVCEYYGCNFHGCINCYQRDRELTTQNGRTLGQTYRDTMLKEKRLRAAGYKLITKWSCGFTKDRKNPETKSFVEGLNIQKPLSMRDSYFGGRTNAITLYKKFTENERGYYVDFTSLYPDVLKYQRYPKYHPTKIDRDFRLPYQEKCTQNQKCLYLDEFGKCSGCHWVLPYFGIMKAEFSPPDDQFFPVLPVKIGGKLKFPLCFACAEKGDIHKICNCSETKRKFIQTYCTPEIEAALNTGYKIERIFEVLDWAESEIYDPLTKEGGLFTDYINTFLKLKQEASGLPENVKTETQIDDYIKRYTTHEGITLRSDHIKKNPGLRSLSKLALNSFYGKFGQRTNLRKTVLVDDLGVLFNMFADHTKEIANFHIMTEKIVAVEFQNHADFEPQSLDTNVTIASFCTAYARLKLWSVLNRLQERVLYHDTDSVIFTAKENEYKPPLGEYLGDLTDELACKELGCKGCDEGHYIVEYISCGPKNYSYRVNTGQTVCKVRGFSLNYDNSKVINFESMKKCLVEWLNGNDSPVRTVKTEIRREKYEAEVCTRKMSKNYGVCYDKRRVVNNYQTVPFGYKCK